MLHLFIFVAPEEVISIVLSGSLVPLLNYPLPYEHSAQVTSGFLNLQSCRVSLPTFRYAAKSKCPLPWHCRCASKIGKRIVTHENLLPQITAGAHMALLQGLSRLASKRLRGKNP